MAPFPRPRVCSCLVLFAWMILGPQGLLLAASDPTTAQPNAALNAGLRLATFDVDATPPVGSHLAYDPVTNAWDLGLRARGIVLLGAGQPIVLCAVDWIGIGNEGHDVFRETLARAAGTEPARVSVHCLHQHDAPDCDFGAEKILRDAGVDPLNYNGDFAREVLARLDRSVRAAVQRPVPIQEVGLGQAAVHQVASNRRILGPDGKVRAVRYTATTDPKLRAEPEGTIDPMVQLVSFWTTNRPVAVLSYYAVHPQSYYRTGIPNPDFPGIARFLRQLAVPDALHVHFNGAGGNLGAGKYNDGSKENRGILAERLADGMRRAWEATKREPLKPEDVRWGIEPVLLPPSTHLVEDQLLAQLRGKNATFFLSGGAARLSWLRRCQQKHPIDITCLTVGRAQLLHLPGELFVEYQLAAKRERPDRFVAMAAYGDYGPGYIGTRVAYDEGGYETSPTSSNVAPDVEGVLMGAIRKLLAEPTRTHWSFQPLRSSAEILASLGSARKSSPSPEPSAIDTFVDARLRERGLQRAPEADRPTLIRRLTFDLHGLPPTPQEIDAFVRDTSARAYDNLVARLLNSPRYGERWGRHWLDVVRFTESQGFEYDKLRDNAWHYRDYLIRSFNEDKPYDRFMREQIAGDVLEPVTRDGIVAASLLVCGPWDEAGNSQANLTQRAITREEEMEDLVGVVGQTFLGLTVNCARCHAHKFDPIPLDDYYRIKAVFDGIKHGERPIASPAESRDRDARIAALQQRIRTEETLMSELASEGRQLALARRSTSSPPPPAGPAPTLAWSFEATPTATDGAAQGNARIVDGQLTLDGTGAYWESPPLSRDLREKTLEAWVHLANLTQGGGAAISLETTGGQVFDAIVFGERQARKWIAGSSGFERTRDLEAPEETASPNEWVHLAAVYHGDGTIELFRNGTPYGKPYKPASPLPTFRAGEARVLLGKRHTGGGRPFFHGSIRSAAVYDRALTHEDIQASFRSAGLHVPLDAALAQLTPARRAEHEAARQRCDSARKELAAIPPLPVSYAGQRVQPAATRVLRRGDVKSPGDVVAPGALSAIPNLPADFGLSTNAPESERRLKFAEWLTHPQNPLPARVMANRVWHFHFGQGLVSTPNDFGASGARPSHPELLDWLASTLVENRWSLKTLHRVIVGSATYRQSSQPNDRALAMDADNVWLWRYAPRRLEAEALRDAMLAVSGQLNPALGGPSFRPFDVLKFPANAYVPVDKPEPEFQRRTVYRMNVNSGKDPLLDSFDCPDPSVKTPRRGVTTTPLQALALMNGSFVQRQATHLAERARREAGETLEDSIRHAYRLTLGRLPSDQESSRAVEAAKHRSLTNVCWALLNTTEFVYVR